MALSVGINVLSLSVSWLLRNLKRHANSSQQAAFTSEPRGLLDGLYQVNLVSSYIMECILIVSSFPEAQGRQDIAMPLRQCYVYVVWAGTNCWR